MAKKEQGSNRMIEEKDLISGNQECLAENVGCNKTEDG